MQEVEHDGNLIRFDPFRGMISMRQVMDRLFDDTVVSPRAWRSINGEAL
ncbi:MAG: hypothetical protein M3P14_04705 [Chloroflexota bacterium]|nr:hypothetical protein [Chloroflexota bacterium]